MQVPRFPSLVAVGLAALIAAAAAVLGIHALSQGRAAHTAVAQAASLTFSGAVTGHLTASTAGVPQGEAQSHSQGMGCSATGPNGRHQLQVGGVVGGTPVDLRLDLPGNTGAVVVRDVSPQNHPNIGGALRIAHLGNLAVTTGTLVVNADGKSGTIDAEYSGRRARGAPASQPADNPEPGKEASAPDSPKGGKTTPATVHVTGTWACG